MKNVYFQEKQASGQTKEEKTQKFMKTNFVWEIHEIVFFHELTKELQTIFLICGKERMWCGCHRFWREELRRRRIFVCCNNYNGKVFNLHSFFSSDPLQNLPSFSHSTLAFISLIFHLKKITRKSFFEAGGEESLTSFLTLHISTFVRRKCIVFKKFVILLKS